MRFLKFRFNSLRKCPSKGGKLSERGNVRGNMSRGEMSGSLLAIPVTPAVRPRPRLPL